MFAELVFNYDLIVHITDFMGMQRAKKPKEPIMCTFTTLQNIEHSARTSFGESNTTYRREKWALPLTPPHPLPPQVLGQVIGAPPEIWVIVNTALLDFLQDAGHE